MRITNWNPSRPGSREGSFSIHFQDGTRVDKCSIFEHCGKVFIAGPEKAIALDGRIILGPIPQMANRATRKKFRLDLLEAVKKAALGESIQ